MPAKILPTTPARSPKAPASADTLKSSAVQGEGDYVSARKYNQQTEAFVKRMAAGAVPAATGKPPSEAEMVDAEKKGLARSRGRAGDRADARVMTEKVRAGTSRRPGSR